VELNPPELFLDRYPHELSAGSRSAVVDRGEHRLRAELLVATSRSRCSTSRLRAGVLNMLDRLRKDGLGILMITHDLSTAARFADRIAVMYLGRIVEEGTGALGGERPAASVHEGAPLGRSAAGPARALTARDPQRRGA
jgi:ABC-type dipeptide/oligopeptide/nickel transport system ATPase component